MKLCEISLVTRRGGLPDLIIEADGVKIVIPRLSKDQRYKLASLIFGRVERVELPCEVEVKDEP